MNTIQAFSIYAFSVLLSSPANALDLQIEPEIKLHDEVEQDDQDSLSNQIFMDLALSGLKREADKGDIWAQAELGHRYLVGLGAKRNLKKAFYWHKLAAQKGFELSHFGLGLIYRGGESSLKDWQTSFMWFSIAYQNGHPRAEKIMRALKRKLTLQQIVEAGNAAKECMRSDYQNCSWPKSHEFAREPSSNDLVISLTHDSMIFPVVGKIIGTFDEKTKEGISILGNNHAPVVAAANGWIAVVKKSGDGKGILVIQHDEGILTVYANLQNIEVSKDQYVERGQKIATLKEEGNSILHFQVRDGYISLNPINYLE